MLGVVEILASEDVSFSTGVGCHLQRLTATFVGSSSKNCKGSSDTADLSTDLLQQSFHILVLGLPLLKELLCDRFNLITCVLRVYYVTVAVKPWG